MKLIIINGPPGVGKSTIATRLQAEMPGSVLIDIDELRRGIPNYREERAESLRQAYEQAKVIVGDVLKAGKDVIIDKAIMDSDVLDAFVATGTKAGAKIYEFLLFADKEVVRARADARGYKEGGMLTPEKVEELWTQADALRTQRTGVVLIDTTNLTLDETFASLANSLK